MRIAYTWSIHDKRRRYAEGGEAARLAVGHERVAIAVAVPVARALVHQRQHSQQVAAEGRKPHGSAPGSGALFQTLFSGDQECGKAKKGLRKRQGAHIIPQLLHFIKWSCSRFVFAEERARGRAWRA